MVGHSRRSQHPWRRTGGALLLMAYVSSCIVIAGLPLVVGIVAAALVPGLGGVAPGLPVFVIGLGLLVVFLLAVFGDTLLRRAVARLFPRGRAMAEEVIAFVLLWLLLRPLTASWIGSFVATAVTVALYKAVEPVLDRMGQRHAGADAADNDAGTADADAD